jgi:hypothetical protein
VRADLEKRNYAAGRVMGYATSVGSNEIFIAPLILIQKDQVLFSSRPILNLSGRTPA